MGAMATAEVQPNETPAVRWCVHTITSRLDRNRRAWAFYQGTQTEPLSFLNRRVAAKLAQASRDMRVNLARTPVTAVLDRLVVEQWTSVTAQEALDELAEDQDLDGLAYEVHERAEAMGESMLLVWPQDLREVLTITDDEELVEEEADGVVLSLEDPRTCAVRYDDEHRHEIAYAGRLWLEDDGRHRVNVYYTDRVERWVEIAKGGDHYALLPEDAEVPGVWRYPDAMAGTVPVFHFRTTRTEHGRPGHADAIPVQTIIDKLVATDAALVDFAGFPIRYAIHKGDPTVGGYDDPDLDDPDDATESAEGRTGNLKASPAEFWRLEADQVGEFAPADPAVILDRLNHYTRALLSVSDTPLSEWEGLGANASGEARRQEQRTLVRKVTRRQGLHGLVWPRALQYALGAGGLEVTDVTVQWADAAELDDSDAWTATRAKVEAGLPLRQALLEHGYTADDLDALGITEEVKLTPEGVAKVVQSVAMGVGTLLTPEQGLEILQGLGINVTEADEFADDPEADPPTPPFAG